MTAATHRRRHAIRELREGSGISHREAVTWYRWQRRYVQNHPTRPQVRRYAKWAAHKAARWTQDAAA